MNNRLLYFDDSEREYILSSYFATHSQLLIRGIGKNAKFEKNIDLVFKSVEKIFIARRFKRIKVWLVLDEIELVHLQVTFHFKLDFGYLVFKIIDESNAEYYINSLAFGIMENDLQLMESCLDKSSFNFEGNKILMWFKKGD